MKKTSTSKKKTTRAWNMLNIMHIDTSETSLFWLLLLTVCATTVYLQTCQIKVGKKDVT